jgi:hypothetical protein
VGSIAGTVAIADGGHLAPGGSAGTFTVGSLVLSADPCSITISACRISSVAGSTI